ncbi:MAG TPA: MEDS domain-containing protein, partial [Ktedonobacteraceae bacterium]|nr:MEDS domain-containing protein [Ktedonobacteraceae bacterium]
MVLSAEHPRIISLKQHPVQFYASEVSLLNEMGTFIGGGLRAGEMCVVFATRDHHERLLERLRDNGLDILAAQARQEYIWRDAAEM